jgi:hypothetical protein
MPRFRLRPAHIDKRRDQPMPTVAHNTSRDDRISGSIVIVRWQDRLGSAFGVGGRLSKSGSAKKSDGECRYTNSVTLVIYIAQVRSKPRRSCASSLITMPGLLY